MKRLIPLLVTAAAIGLLVALSGCGSDSDRPTTADAGGPITVVGVDSGSSVQVVLGLYSGRPDPAWTLKTEQAKALAAAIAPLARVEETAPSGGLGYHGFTIVTAEGSMVAFGGKVLSADSDPAYILDDPDRTIERLLLATAQPHVTAEELRIVADALKQQ